MIDKIKALLVCLGVLFPAALLGAIGSFLATPLLWKLEDVLHVELAGHSGPADWIIVSAILLLWAVFVIIYLSRRRKS
jgi:hypothetical protein